MNCSFSPEVLVPVLDCLCSAGNLLAVPVHGLWAYFGLGAGQELIPYFVGLLALIGTALLAVLQWPLFALRRLLAKRGHDRGQPNSEPAREPLAATTEPASPRATPADDANQK